MATSANDLAIQIIISPDKSRAELYVPPGFPPDRLTQQACIRPVIEAGIPSGQGVSQKIVTLIASAKTSHGGELRTLIAETLPPVAGEDGRVEWSLGEAGNEPQEQGDDPIDFYAQSSYTLVEPRQVIGKIIPTIPGVPGTDIFGKPIAAKNGKPARIKLGKNICKSPNGELVAQAGGPLVCSGDHVKILDLIEVPEYVDFSTGNIQFQGDVHIHKGVRDRFVVQATGHVIIDGLVEAATIKCGGTLAVRGGFAGRERGVAQIGGDMAGKYLDNVQGEVKGELRIDREIVNSELTVCGTLNSPTSTIMGGKITCHGKAELAVLGSPSGAPTQLVMTGKKDPVQLTIHRWLRTDAVIHIANKSYKIHTDVRGPIQVSVGMGRQVFYAREHAEPMPLSHIANAQSEAA